MAYETVPNKCKPLKRTFNWSLLLQDKKVKTVCVMPCYDKKLEAVRPNFKFGGPQELTLFLQHMSCSISSSSKGSNLIKSLLTKPQILKWQKTCYHILLQAVRTSKDLKFSPLQGELLTDTWNIFSEKLLQTSSKFKLMLLSHLFIHKARTGIIRKWHTTMSRSNSWWVTGSSIFRMLSGS